MVVNGRLCVPTEEISCTLWSLVDVYMKKQLLLLLAMDFVDSNKQYLLPLLTWTEGAYTVLSLSVCQNLYLNLFI